MYETEIRIEFLSDWHIGSGLGDGAIADAVLARDSKGIPTIPGSAVKGALREGAWRLGLCDQGLAALPDFFFGTASETRASNQPGIVCVGQASLDKSLRSWLEGQDNRSVYIQDMTTIRQQTRLDARKMVVPHSLRSIECGIPGLIFTSQLAVAAPAGTDAWLEAYFNAVCACVKSIGGYRSRGIGRCRLLPSGKKGHCLPGPAPSVITELLEAGRENENS